MGEVDGPSGVVAVDACDGSVVALEHFADARLAAPHTHTKTETQLKSSAFHIEAVS